MPVWSFALRLLLCLVVALNGASPVIGAMHAHAKPASASTPAHPATAHAGCHASLAMSTMDPHADHAAVSPGHPEKKGGCCDSADCACACIHHAPATLAAMMPSIGSRSREGVAARTEAGHTPPPWRVHIRPPIG